MSAEELARRAVACKGWRWMGGMQTRRGQRVCFIVDEDYASGDGGCVIVLSDALPDLNDPATLGCFAFALLPDAWGPDADVTVHADGSCEIEVPGSDPAEIARLGCPYRVGHGFENVVECLEAAP